MSADSDNPPEIKDQPGPWDEIVNRAILLLPFIALVALVAWLITTGTVTVGTISIEGTVPVRPLALGAGGLFGFTYLLALAKFYGLAPLSWLFNRLHNLAKNYNPGDESEGNE